METDPSPRVPTGPLCWMPFWKSQLDFAPVLQAIHRRAHRDVELAEDGAWLGTGTRAGLREGDIRTGVRPGCLEEVPFEMGLEGRTAAAVDGSPHQSSSQSSLPCPCPAVSNKKHSFLVSLLLSISPPLEC